MYTGRGGRRGRRPVQRRLLRLCGAGSMGFSIPAYFFISGISCPKILKGPSAGMDQQQVYGDALTSFIKAIGEGINSLVANAG